MVELKFVRGLRNLPERQLIIDLIYDVKKSSMGAPSFILLAYMLNAIVPHYPQLPLGVRSQGTPRSDEIGNPSGMYRL